MASRKRIRAKSKDVSGGIADPTVGNLSWGPDFGEGAGSDDKTFEVGAALSLASVDLEGTLGVGTAIDLSSVDLAGSLGVGVAVDLDQVNLEGTLGVGLDIESYTVDIVEMLADKDTWYPNVALCPDDNNKDGTDLQVEGVTATRKDAPVAWDLSGFPSTATVNSASITVNIKDTPTAGSIKWDGIPTGEEGWDETTISCSGALTREDTGASLSNSDMVLGDNTDDLGATNETRIENRMGVGDFTILMNGQTPLAILDNMEIQSKDSGGTPGNASGPRISFNFTVTV